MITFQMGSVEEILRKAEHVGHEDHVLCALNDDRTVRVPDCAFQASCESIPCERCGSGR